MSKPAKKNHRKLFTVGSDAPFQFTEAYKSLRTNLEFLSASGSCKTILITSSVPEEGKTNVAVNLAITLASSGKRVVLVDCDMRKSAVSRYLRIPRSRTGLTNVITSHEENALASALIRMKDTGITVLASPLSTGTFVSAIQMLGAMSRKIQRLLEENAKLQRKLEDERYVSRAKALLIEKQGMPRGRPEDHPRKRTNYCNLNQICKRRGQWGPGSFFPVSRCPLFYTYRISM